MNFERGLMDVGLAILLEEGREVIARNFQGKEIVISQFPEFFEEANVPSFRDFFTSLSTTAECAPGKNVWILGAQDARLFIAASLWLLEKSDFRTVHQALSEMNKSCVDLDMAQLSVQRKGLLQLFLDHLNKLKQESSEYQSVVVDSSEEEVFGGFRGSDEESPDVPQQGKFRSALRWLCCCRANRQMGEKREPFVEEDSSEYQ